MGKFSQFAQKTKKYENTMEQNIQNNTTEEQQDLIPAKDKNPDDLEYKG